MTRAKRGASSERRPGSRLRAARLALFLALAVGVPVACTHDFDEFVVGPAPSGDSGADAATGGGAAKDAATDGSPASGGVPSGGAGGGGAGGSDVDAGAGGTPAGGGSASGGASAGGGPTGGSGNCGNTRKSCGNQCVGLADPATGCAAESCAPCDLTNVDRAACVGGECAPSTCDATFGNCNGRPDDGCERRVTDDIGNCGDCDRGCSGNHVGARECTGSQCTSYCDPGWANCQRPQAGFDEGCETDALTNNAHCGGCGNSCFSQGLSCMNGTCGCSNDVQCRSGAPSGEFCDEPAGLCHCGAETCERGEKCGGRGGCSCNGGRSCGPGQTCCQTPAGCRDLDGDPGNCGACGHACPPGFACAGGQCRCDGDSDCAAGTSGTCAAGVCSCGGTACQGMQRCDPTGACR